jgi:hypothetical protein
MSNCLYNIEISGEISWNFFKSHCKSLGIEYHLLNPKVQEKRFYQVWDNKTLTYSNSSYEDTGSTITLSDFMKITDLSPKFTVKDLRDGDFVVVDDTLVYTYLKQRLLAKGCSRPISDYNNPSLQYGQGTYISGVYRTNKHTKLDYSVSEVKNFTCIYNRDQIFIGENPVVIGPDGITVGCTKVDMETLRKIAKALDL